MKATVETPEGNFCNNCFFLTEDYKCFLFGRYPRKKDTGRTYIDTYSPGDMSDNTGYYIYHYQVTKLDICINKKDCVHSNGTWK